MHESMKKSIVFLLLMVCIPSCYSSNKKLIAIERFTYYTEDSIPIQSTLYLPQNELKRIVIQIFSIDLEYKQPDFTAISDSVRYRGIVELVSTGTGVCLFSPRVQATMENFELQKKQTTETLATDVENAYRFLKKDKRFAHIPIGVMGHSASGIAAAKVAARDTSIDFAMLIVTPSTPNIDEADYKWTNNPETSGVPGYKILISLFRPFFPSDNL